MKPVTLQARNLCKHYKARGAGLFGQRKTVRALNDVSFEVRRGEIVAVVGESGCGKSTLAKVLLGLTPSTSGSVSCLGNDYGENGNDKIRLLRRHIQIVFQDPYSSLNPRRSVFDSIAEPLRNFSLVRDEDDVTAEVLRLLALVGLDEEAAYRFPHKFSGGQRQRICIARALACQPDILVCDEAVSALDVSVKAQIINLLMDINRERGISIIFISHDLGIVEYMADHVIVMYMGGIVEAGSAQDVFYAPAHPYTKALLAAVPVVDAERRPARALLKGEVPSNSDDLRGCPFFSRCAVRLPVCETVTPVLASGSDHVVACHLAGNSRIPIPTQTD